MLDKKFIQRKINLIQEELENIAPLQSLSLEKISQDPIKQAATERFLERVVNRAIDINQHILAETDQNQLKYSSQKNIPLTYKETFTQLAKLNIYSLDFAEKISQSVGLCNILIHEYDKINLTSVYSSLKDCLQDYNQYCQYILEFIKKQA